MPVDPEQTVRGRSGPLKGDFVAPPPRDDSDEKADALPAQEEFWRPPTRFGSVPVEKEPLGWDKKRGYRKLFPEVMLPTQVVERVSFGHPELEPNRLFWGDNLHVMRQLPSESIDLIYIDPPFFSGRQYNVIFGDQNELRSFSDIWEGGMPGYLIWLNARLYEMKRLLKKTGSLILHCDWHASHYIKVELDKVFGPDSFRNEIIWCYRQGGRSNVEFPKKHDVLLWYSRGQNWTFDADVIRVPYEGTGGFQTSGKGVTNKATGRTYLPNPKGKVPEDWWDIPALPPMSAERIGYPTQKPEQLLRRIIQCCSQQQGVVADFFCGGGTTPAAAQKLGRRWIACDQSRVAVAITADRLAKAADQLTLTFAAAKPSAAAPAASGEGKGPSGDGNDSSVPRNGPSAEGSEPPADESGSSAPRNDSSSPWKDSVIPGSNPSAEGSDPSAPGSAPPAQGTDHPLQGATSTGKPSGASGAASEAGAFAAIPDFTIEHWGVYEAKRLSETPPDQFRDFILRAFGATPEPPPPAPSPSSREPGEGRLGIHGHKGVAPVWVGEPSMKSQVTAKEVQEFANAVRKTVRYQQDNLRDGIMLAWAFRPDAIEAAQRLREMEQTDVNFIRLDMVRIDSPRFREHITALTTDHADYANFLTFIQPPQVHVGSKRIARRTYVFDVSDTVLMNSGAKIINVQWDFSFDGKFRTTQGYAFLRTSKKEPELRAQYEFPGAGRNRVACRVQDDMGGEGFWVGDVEVE